MNAWLHGVRRAGIGAGRSIAGFARGLAEVGFCYNNRLVPMRAAGVAFYFLLGLIPFLFITTALAGYLFRRNPSTLVNLATTLQSLLPPGLGERIMGQVTGAVEGWHAFGILGLVSLAFVSMGMFEALDWGINGAMGTHKKVGFLKGRLIFLAYLTGAMLFFSLAAVADYSFQLMLAAPALHDFAARIHLPRRTISMASVFVFLFILYMLIPLRTPRAARSILVALVVSGIWAVVQKLGATMTVYISRRHAIYGALAGGTLFLTWMYLFAMLILVGATVLDVWERAAAVRRGRPMAAPADE